MKMYFKYLSLQAKTAFEYRTALIFNMFTSALATIATFFGIILLFQKFDTIAGYTVNEVLITYSMIVFSFSTAECFFRGFDEFDKLVRTGELDRLYIRPRSIFLQVLGSKIEFTKLGRSIFGLVMLIIALTRVSITWTAMRVLVVIMMMIGGIVIFAGMFLIYSSVSIFTVEGLEVMNVLTNGGKNLCYYPLDVYFGSFRKIFTYIIPFGCINYLPLQYLLGFSNAGLLHALCPLFSIVFFAVCYLIFRWSLTKYKSTGS